MTRACTRLVVLCGLLFAIAAAPASGFHDRADHSTTMNQLFNAPNASKATNSDLAFWGNRAYAGDYDGFRIFDISNPRRPRQMVDFRCFGPQNDPVVYRNRLLFLAVDATLTGPQCGAEPTEQPDDPTGWEGVRIFDVSNPSNPRLVGNVYTDCGAHTITMYPKSSSEILLYVSSYPLIPGPTCGETRGPAAGNSPLHEKISVISVPVDDPDEARVIAQPRISYPGDTDNTFDPAEHGLAGLSKLTACHDIGVFVELRLAAGACAEQAQLWRIGTDGIPDTENPLWVYDDSTDTDGPGGGDVAVDFWHSATFSWDGKIVNFIDESFGVGCPPVTNITSTMNPQGTPSDTGRMFFLDAADGEKLSHFTLPRQGETAPHPEFGETAYCSAHLGNTVPSPDRHLLVNAWYMGGADVIDFTNPRHPVEIAFYDAQPFGPTGSDNWSAYWYEAPGSRIGGGLTLYGTDGVHNPETGRGFQTFWAQGLRDFTLSHLNPQTQERVMAPTEMAGTARAAQSRATTRASGATAPAAQRRLAP